MTRKRKKVKYDINNIKKNAAIPECWPVKGVLPALLAQYRVFSCLTGLGGQNYRTGGNRPGRERRLTCSMGPQQLGLVVDVLSVSVGGFV